MIFLGIIVLIVAVDQVTKYMARKHLSKQNVQVSNKLIFTIAKNKGAAYNVLESKPYILNLLAFLCLIVFSVKLVSNIKNGKSNKLALAFIIGGGLSNLGERVISKYVTDFIYIKWKKAPVFNIADVFILFGMVLYFINEVIFPE